MKKYARHEEAVAWTHPMRCPGSQMQPAHTQWFQAGRCAAAKRNSCVDRNISRFWTGRFSACGKWQEGYNDPLEPLLLSA
eukprot:1156940-Pelagomonas_calceolata.AAC.3